MSQFNVIIPMAGESRRFNYEFKPFIQISDETFIELAYKYFEEYRERICKLYFIITQQQEDEFNINYKLKKIFSNYQLIIIPKKTAGPFMTIKKSLSKINTDIPYFICDCDHSINIKPMIDKIDNMNDLSIIIPYWDIENENENIEDWGIMYLEGDNIINFSEKILVDDYLTENYSKYVGIIGCYYFKDLTFFSDNDYINITDGLYNYRSKCIPVKINNAEFFGDKKRLTKTIYKRKQIKTIFCDIDGTIIKHNNSPTNEHLEFLPNSLQKLNQWKTAGYRIIMTTSRTKKNEVSKLLQKYKVPYDDLICNLPSGERYLINDVKDNLRPMSLSYNVIRDKGINSITLDSEQLIIYKELKGNSFSKVLVIESNKKLFVRKYIIKTNENKRHYKKLKRQYYDIQRLNSYCPGLCPKIYDENDLDYLYYFDIEYLENYSQVTVQNISIIYNLLDILNKEIYSSKKINNDKQWLDNFISNKININEYKKLDKIIDAIFNMDTITINNKKYKGLPYILKNINTNLFNPKYLSVIHGDLTFENILFMEDDIKLIDLDGSDFIDAIELDFGKLLQSYLSNYEYWSNPSISNKLIKEINLTQNYINTYDYKNYVDDKFYQYWSILLDNSDINYIRKKGIFYMCTHLLRMIPYRYHSDINSTIYCIKEIIVWLNYII